MNGRGGLFEMWTIPGGIEKSQCDGVRLIPPALPHVPSLPTAPAQVLKARCCWQTSHLTFPGGFQFGTRKANSKWCLL